MKVKLTDAEVKIAEYIAKCRYKNAKDTGAIDNKRGNQDDWVTELEGVASEMAFCKLMNVYPDFDIDNYGYADCYTTRHGAIDVKATKYKNGRLLAVAGKGYRDDLPDSYVLMIGTCPEYMYVGYLPAEELVRDDRLGDLGHGKTYIADQKDLKK